MARTYVLGPVTLAGSPGADLHWGMDRRLAGLTVLMVAVLVAVLVPVLDGRRVAGTARAVSVPVAGDCLIGVHSRWDQPSTVVADAGWPPFPLTTGSISSCSQPGAGQVLAVDYAGAAPAAADGAEYQRHENGLCTPAIERMSDGLVRGRDHIWRRGTVEIGFRPVVRLQGELAFPSTATGSDRPPWIACFAVTLTASGTKPFVLHASRPADDLGSCEVAAPGAGDLRATPCSAPHTAQVLGRAFLASGSPTGADYLAACQEFARYITGATDPNAAGVLRIRVRQTFEWLQGPGTCLAVVNDPERTLSGSLVDIGDGPLPWTN